MINVAGGLGAILSALKSMLFGLDEITQGIQQIKQQQAEHLVGFHCEKTGSTLIALAVVIHSQRDANKRASKRATEIFGRYPRSSHRREPYLR